ncbi:MAG: type II toxin-antitoxin system PemK/MazF family toxin [Saprospiraceae bacterium]
MVTKEYIPDQLDIIMIDLDPQMGTEIAKGRPCLVLSPKILNKKNNRILACPIISGSPKSLLHIILPISLKIVHRTLLLDQARSLDFKSRNAKK